VAERKLAAAECKSADKIAGAMVPQRTLASDENPQQFVRASNPSSPS
jgi:hypothetical protein